MSSYKSCGNCLHRAKKEFCEFYPYWMEMCWEKIPCPHCRGILSEIRVHKEQKYRHCYSCHFEFKEET